MGRLTLSHRARQTLRLRYTPRKLVVHPEFNTLIVAEADHGALPWAERPEPSGAAAMDADGAGAQVCGGVWQRARPGLPVWGARRGSMEALGTRPACEPLGSAAALPGSPGNGRPRPSLWRSNVVCQCGPGVQQMHRTHVSDPP